MPSFLKLLGLYGGHLFNGTALLLLTLLATGAVSILISWLPLVIDDAVYLGFAYLMHLVLLVCDGLLCASWMLYWVLKGIKELL